MITYDQSGFAEGHVILLRLNRSLLQNPVIRSYEILPLEDYLHEFYLPDDYQLNLLKLFFLINGFLPLSPILYLALMCEIHYFVSYNFMIPKLSMLCNVVNCGYWPGGEFF